MTIVLWSIVAVIASIVLWYGSGLLETASEKLSTYYNLPPIVQGAVIVAVGSSFPELSTVVISTLLHGEFELGVSAIVGSAIFNILAIPALCGLITKKPININARLVYKEAQFYMVAVAGLLITFAFAVIYNPVSGGSGSIQGTLTRNLSIIPVLLYGIYVFIQYQDTMDHKTVTNNENGINPFKQWGGLVLSLLIILIGVELIVRSALAFGDYFNTPSFLWGATVVAASTSIPDAFVSVQTVRENNGVTAIANVLGSNIFDLLICIPIGIFIAGATIINFSIAAPMLGALIVGTVALFGIMRMNLSINQFESYILLTLYLLFVIWITVESFGLINTVPSLPPA